jgi:superoxide reductase
MTRLGDLIYSPERASGEAISKAESHTPKIEAPDRVKAGEPFKIKISVGPHPNTVEHSIRWIEVYFEEDGRAFNPVMIARYAPTPGIAEPSIEFTVKLEKSGTIHVLAYCNLHGLWENSKRITVE